MPSAVCIRCGADLEAHGYLGTCPTDGEPSYGYTVTSGRDDFGPDVYRELEAEARAQETRDRLGDGLGPWPW